MSKKKRKLHEIWYTNDEKTFIKNLGKTGGRIEKLIKYRDAMKDRVRWGFVNKKIIEDYVKKTISEEQQKEKLDEYYNIRGF